MMRPLLLAASLAVAGSATAAPSFNCAKAGTPGEKAICANSALADQDAAIARQYKDVREKLDAEAAKSLTADQRYFLGMRDRVYEAPFSQSTPVKEMATFMRTRLALLKAINPRPAAGFVGKWRNIEGEIEITQGANGQLAVAVSSWMPYYGNWVCDLSGNAVVDGDSLKVTYKDGPPWVLTLTRRGAVLVARETAPPGSPDDGSGPPYCGHKGGVAGDWFAAR